MDLSSSSLRRVDDEPDPAIMLFGKRIKGPSTTDAAEIKETLSPRGVDEAGVSFGTSSEDEEEELRNNPNAQTNEDEIKPGGEPREMGSQAKPKPGAVRCPRCHSADTKFCYFNNYNVNQPRHFCKHCQRYWTAGGTLRNVPVGAGKRKSTHSVRKSSPPLAHDGHSPPTNLRSFLRNVQTNLELFAEARPNLQFEPPELGLITSNPQSGFSGLDEIKTNSLCGFSGLGKINLNLQSQFSRLGEIKANLPSTSSGLSEMNFNLQSGFSGFAQIDPKLQSGIPGFGEIKANLQSEIYRLCEVEASQQCVLSRFGQSDANLQSGSGHLGCTESDTVMINSPSGGNGSSEIDSRGYSEIKAHSAGECNGFRKIKDPLFRFHGNEPHLSLGVNNTEGSFRNNCAESKQSYSSQ